VDNLVDPRPCPGQAECVDRKAANSARLGKPEREPSRVHFMAATALAKRAQSANGRPSAKNSVKAP